METQPHNLADPLAELAAHAEEFDHARRPRRRPRLPRNEITLNLTAMLDMAFQLLIFFVLTANFAAGEGVLAANLPSGGGGGAAADAGALPAVRTDIYLRSVGNNDLLGDFEIYLGNDRVPTFSALTNELALREPLADDPAHPGTQARLSPVVIHAQPGVAWQHVVNAFNAAVRAKFSNVAFAQTDEK